MNTRVQGRFAASPAAERFWEKVNKGNACWIWMGALRSSNNGGYGTFLDDGRMVQAHRWAYEQARGPIPAGMQLDHLCRVTLCVNPEHLEVVTPRQNTLRGVSPAASRAKQTHCKRGHSLGGENLRTSPGMRGWRACRACNNLTGRLWRERNPDAANAQQVRRRIRSALRAARGGSS